MKYLYVLLLIGSVTEAKEFNFKYVLRNDILEYKTKADTWEEAFKRGADFCFDFFVKKRTKINENEALDIIDTCVNPR